jgi:hypothetical protein
MITGDFINGSSSVGALIIVYSLTNDSNIQYIITPHLLNQLRVSAMVTGLPRDQYNISVFVLENGGQVVTSAVSTPRQLQIAGMLLYFLQL